MSVKPIKTLFTFGTRPEAIKTAPVIIEMRRQHPHFEPLVCTTGQHRQMLDQVLATFDISPDYDLRVMTPNQTLTDLTSNLLNSIDRVVLKDRPDLIVVQGDTTTTLAAALIGFYHQIPVAHIEAGLRTGDLRHPFPEELNRVVVDRFADFCFAPTDLNRRNLVAEGVPPDRIIVTGNTGIDALFFIRGRVQNRDAKDWDSTFSPAVVAACNSTSPLILVTAHRRESFGEALLEIFSDIRRAAERHPDWNFIYPVHLNPNVQTPAHEIFSNIDNVHLTEPVPYEPFVYLLNRANVILTDSGGIQEEATALGKQVIVLRQTTERREAIDAGVATVIGNSGARVAQTLEAALGSSNTAAQPQGSTAFGDGQASQRIMRHLATRFS